MDDPEKTEAFAHQRALDHMEHVVVPYLDETYPGDWRTLDWWSSSLELLV